MVFRFRLIGLVFLSLFLVSGCAETELLSHYAKRINWPGQEDRSQGSFKVGNPYKIGGTWYRPQENYNHTETGIASWYGPGFHGRKTANGEIYDQNELTAAHRTLQMPSLVRVTNLENGRSIIVRVNDRGPYKSNRVMDVSKRSAELLGFIGKGTTRVRIVVMENESRQLAAAAKRGKDTSRIAFKESVSAPRQALYTPRTLQPRIQVAQNGGNAYLRDDAHMGGLPESLQPTYVTPEELNAQPYQAPPDDEQDGDISSQTLTPLPGAEATGRYVAPAAKPAQKPESEFINQLSITKDVPQPVEETATIAAPAPAPSTTAMASGAYVQAGSFAVRQNAINLAAKLDSIGASRVDEIEIKGRQLWRVRIGPFASVAEAKDVLGHVVKSGNPTARVVVEQ